MICHGQENICINNIFISYPIKENDKIIGTLIGSIKFDSISSYAAKIKISKEGLMLLFQ